LGGSMITHDEFYKMYEIMDRVVKTGKLEKESYWVPFEI